MEFAEAHKLFINAVTSQSLAQLRQQMKKLKALNLNLARECCVKVLCSLTEEDGDYLAIIKEIIDSSLFESPHNHLVLSLAATLIYNTAKRCNNVEKVYQIIACLASRFRLAFAEVLDYLDEDGLSALHLSVMNGDIRATKILQKLGSDTNKKSQSGNTALSMSIAYRQFHLLPLFIHDSNVNTQDNDHDTPLMFAAWSKQYKLISTLIQCGADVNSVSKYGSTALWNAVYRCCPECVLILLSHNAQMTVECEGTHLFTNENDCNCDEEKVKKIYPGHKRSLLWVSIDRFDNDERSLKVLLILIEAGYDVTKEHWLKNTLSKKVDCPKKLYSNSPLLVMLRFLYSRPQSLKDLCRNSLRRHHGLSSLSFHEWLLRLELPPRLNDFLSLSYFLRE